MGDKPTEEMIELQKQLEEAAEKYENVIRLRDDKIAIIKQEFEKPIRDQHKQWEKLYNQLKKLRKINNGL